MLIKRGSNAYTVMGMLPCKGMVLPDRPAVTRFSTEDPFSPGAVWDRLDSGSEMASRYVVPILTDGGLPQVCTRADVDYARGGLMTHDIPRELNYVTYMEAAAGRSLDQVLVDPKYSDDLKRASIERALHGISFIHSRGVAHTDPHLGNFIVGKDRVRMIDWSEAVTKADAITDELIDRLDQSSFVPGALLQELRAKRDFRTLQQIDIAILVRSLQVVLTRSGNLGALSARLASCSFFPQVARVEALIAHDLQDAVSPISCIPHKATDVIRTLHNMAPRTTNRKLFDEFFY